MMMRAADEGQKKKKNKNKKKKKKETKRKRGFKGVPHPFETSQKFFQVLSTPEKKKEKK